MRLSEMTTDQMAKCMCELVAPAAEIMADEAVLKALSALSGAGEKPFLRLVADAATAIVPLLLKTHYSATVAILAAMTGKSCAEIRRQKGLQTIKDARECIDHDLIDFFTPSATTAKIE